MTRPITVDVFSASGTAALTNVGTLGSDEKREWLEDLVDTGSFSVEVKVGHADEALLTDGRFVRFSINGTPAWWALVEPRSKVSADPRARESGRIITVTGRGALAVLEQAIVYPELGLGRVSPDARFFNFASLNYDDTAWGNAVQLKQVNDPDSTKPWFGAPKNWTDTAAWWVGPTGGMTTGGSGVTPGDIYLRGSFTVAAGQGGEYRFSLTADDGFELYVDGNKVQSEQVAGLWGDTRQVDLLLDDGSHLVAVKVTNFARPVASTNVFGFILSVSKILGGGTSTGTVVSRSSSGTKMLAYPAAAPGMTPGQILKVLIDEAHARGGGAILPLHYDFTAAVDSAGTAWPKQIDISFPVGTTLLDVARRLVAERACDVSIKASSTTLTLQAWVSKGSDLHASVAATYGTNIGALQHNRTPVGANTVLTRTAEGRWVETANSTAVSAWGRREANLSLGSAPSDDAAARQTTAFLNSHAQPADVITAIRLEPVSKVPYVDFNVGDRISAPGYDGSAATFWVTGVKVSEDEAGNPIYELDMETP